MHFFVILLMILLAVLVAALVGGALYLTSTPSDEKLLNELTFAKIDSSFGNGVFDGTLWPAPPAPYEQPILAKVGSIRTFLALAEWARLTPMPMPLLPLFFLLPEPAVSVRTYIAAQLNVIPSGDDLVGVLVSPTHVGFKFVSSGSYLTGNEVLVPGLQELAVIIVYTTA